MHYGKHFGLNSILCLENVQGKYNKHIRYQTDGTNHFVIKLVNLIKIIFYNWLWYWMEIEKVIIQRRVNVQ